MSHSAAAVMPVNGHGDLPSGGHEISPCAVMSFAPLAAMRFPHSRESGWIGAITSLDEEIGDRDRFVTRRAESTWADAAAEAAAVRAILVTQKARPTRWAFIDGAWSC